MIQSHVKEQLHIEMFFWNKGKLLIVVAWQDNAKLVLISCLSEVQDINVIWKKNIILMTCGVGMNIDEG